MYTCCRYKGPLRDVPRGVAQERIENPTAHDIVSCAYATNITTFMKYLHITNAVDVDMYSRKFFFLELHLLFFEDQTILGGTRSVELLPLTESFQ